ncbi:MAG: pyridoxamine 5'-phosphate oxidase family protein [Ignavibacteriaceae bacterium]|nr:pyridoxamine 5'-phosphate oxidase family protein [Ignavibacteriaceae bacterium]
MISKSEYEIPQYIPEIYSNTSQVFDSIIKALAEGVTNRRHPFHTPVISTINGDKPELRTVVLRDFNKDLMEILIHSDYRTGKVSQLKLNPNTSFLFYDGNSAVQVRVRGISFVHYTDDTAFERWQISKPASRRCYLTTVHPGEEISVPDSTLPADYKNITPSLTESESGYKNFCVIRTVINEIDWLYLHKSGNIRAAFKITEGKLHHSSWLAP